MRPRPIHQIITTFVKSFFMKLVPPTLFMKLGNQSLQTGINRFLRLETRNWIPIMKTFSPRKMRSNINAKEFFDVWVFPHPLSPKPWRSRERWQSFGLPQRSIGLHTPTIHDWDISTEIHITAAGQPHTWTSPRDNNHLTIKQYAQYQCCDTISISRPHTWNGENGFDSRARLLFWNTSDHKSWSFAR